MERDRRGGVRIGRHNTLSIVKKVDFGFYLDGGDDGEILLPGKYAPEEAEVGDEIRVFVYYDSDDRLIATTETPKAEVGQVAFLEVKDVSKPGAFLDWGLIKDLLVPFREQQRPMVVGRKYIVYVFQDEETGRIVASSKLRKFLDNTMPRYRAGDEVDAIVTEITELGYKLAIDDAFTGLLYASETFKTLHPGDRLKAYVKKVRDDDKIDLSLTPLGYAKVGCLADEIIGALQQAGGRLPFSDKSSPEEIQKAFGCSKKSFKMTIGTLYREGRIDIGQDGIALRDNKR